MQSKTISISIPKQLEIELQNKSVEQGISRSRYICNILLDWQRKKERPINDCFNQRDGWCKEFNIACSAPQHEAETCSDYGTTNKVGVK